MHEVIASVSEVISFLLFQQYQNIILILLEMTTKTFSKAPFFRVYKYV